MGGGGGEEAGSTGGVGGRRRGQQREAWGAGVKARGGAHSLKPTKKSQTSSSGPSPSGASALRKVLRNLRTPRGARISRGAAWRGLLGPRPASEPDTVHGASHEQRNHATSLEGGSESPAALRWSGERLARFHRASRPGLATCRRSVEPNHPVSGRRRAPEAAASLQAAEAALRGAQERPEPWDGPGRPRGRRPQAGRTAVSTGGCTRSASTSASSPSASRHASATPSSSW